MKNDYENINEGARTKKRAKRRKTNLILNSLIVVVILLIVFVSVNIFFSNDEGAADNSKVAGENQKAASSEKKKTDSENNTDDKSKSSTAEDTEPIEEEADAEDSEEQGEPVVTEGGSDANVKQTITNPEWKPVGTTQTGEHGSVFDQNSVDWQEMMLAYSYATGIAKENMTVWWNQNNGAPNTAVGTVSEKGSDQTYRVAIEWVDGQGWKPVAVEELIQNDRR